MDRSWIGIALLSAGLAWMAYASKRRKNRRGPLQILIDFFTGAPAESVLIVGTILLGLMALASLLF